MIQEVIHGERGLNTAKEKMTKTMNVMRTNLLPFVPAGRTPRTDRILVDYYGDVTPIQQLGNIATPEPRILQISVWMSGDHDIERPS